MIKKNIKPAPTATKTAQRKREKKALAIMYAMARDQKALDKKQAAEKIKNDKKRQREIHQSSVEALHRSLSKLADASQLAYAIENGGDAAGNFDSEALGLFARLTIHDVGEQLERALCNLGLIKGGEDCGIFARDGLLVPEGKALGATKGGAA